MAAPVKTPSTETREYSIIFRIRWCPFPFHLICERCQSPYTHRTPLWSQTHRRLKTNMGSRAEKSVTSKRRVWSGEKAVFTTRPTLFLTHRVYAIQRFRLNSAILASTEQGQEAAPLDESSYTNESLYAMGRCYCRFFRLRR